jgi:hypothetical protein
LSVRIGEDLLEQGNEFPHVIAGGQFRYHAAIVRVQVDLAVEDVCKEAGFAVVKGETCFVAGSFDAENEHGRGV